MSFDVMSLFTRVPTSRAIQVTRGRLMNDPSLPDKTSLTVDDICSLLQLCLEATYLAFEGKVYRQIHGTAMGSPVSVVVANLVMEDVEQEALSTFHTPSRFWRRYREEDGSVYRKATHTDQYLCFHSHHPAAHKQAAVRTLMCRAEALSSSGVRRPSLRQE